MLKITHHVARAANSNQQLKPVEAQKSELKPARGMKKLSQIKERIEAEMDADHQRYRQGLAEMFLAGPLAWPDYPESEELDWSEEDDEEWIPLDCCQDSQLRADSSDGQK